MPRAVISFLPKYLYHPRKYYFWVVKYIRDFPLRHFSLILHIWKYEIKAFFFLRFFLHRYLWKVIWRRADTPPFFIKIQSCFGDCIIKYYIYYHYYYLVKIIIPKRAVVLILNVPFSPLFRYVYYYYVCVLYALTYIRFCAWKNKVFTTSPLSTTYILLLTWCYVWRFVGITFGRTGTET